MYNSNCSFENGGIAQLARACGSYPQCPRFESRCRYHKRRSLNTAPFIRPVGQAVKTPPFHGGNMGSIPVRVTKKQKPTEWWAFAFCNLRRESKGAGVNDMPVACQSRDLARPQARIPVRVTTSSQASYRLRRFFMLSIKNHLALTALLLLSNLNPLRWASSWFYAMQQSNIANAHIYLVKSMVFW